MVRFAPLNSPSPAAGQRSRVAGLAAAIVLGAIVMLAPTPDGLAPAGQRMAALFAVALVLWTTEAIPIAATALLVLVLQPLLGVADLRTAFAAAMSPVFFFVLAMFCIATAFSTSGLDRRFALTLLGRAGTDSRRVLLAFMAGTATISTIMSDVPACAIFMSIALGLFAENDIRPGESKFGRAVMIGIPIAALIGGVATPAGSSINIIGIDFIERFGGVRVPFLHWMAIGVPMALVMTPIAWWVLARTIGTERSVIGDVGALRRELAAMGALRPAEWKLIAILGTMLALWIASTWVRAFDVALVALCGSVAMFLPGIGLLEWKQVERGTGWDTLLMIAGVTSIGAASVDTGLAKWIVERSMGGLDHWTPLWIVAAASAFTVAVHLVLPIGPVVNAVLIPPIVLLAKETGHNPALYALPVAFTASCAFLLPLDPVPLLTYTKGYYRMLDMLAPGAVLSAVWVAVMTVLMLLVAPAVGLL
jgi:sodium-dependent dicarboxylate transporter 2/3/5